ncbi:MAG: PAS domain S-box protein [Methanobacteriaceae archaeon]|nr:PAS domain S-box protein [Methanobacteriaceae archaeon]
MSEAKILVVEDEGLTAMEIQRKLKNWGYKVPSFAFSRKEAVKKAKEMKPDLILMDVMLKGEGDGVDAAKEIKSEQDIPIIYITAYDDIKTRKRAESTNPDAYLIKPYEEHELQNKIKSVLSGHDTWKKLIEIGKRLETNSKDLGIIVIDSEGIIRYSNKVASDLTGSESEKILLKYLYEVFPIKDINDEKDFTNYLEEIFINNKAGITDRSVIKQDTGKNINLEYSFNPIYDNNEVIGASLVFKELSKENFEEKIPIQSPSESAMEKQLNKFYQKSLIQDSLVATEIFNKKGELVNANPACLKLFGAEKVEELRSFRLFESFKMEAEDIKALKEDSKISAKCQFSAEELREFGLNIKTEDSIYLSLYISPLKLDETVEGYLVQFQDISTPRKREESHIDNEKLHLEILNTLDQAVIAFDGDLKSFYFNNEFNELLGLKNSDIIGKSLSESIKPLWDEELETMCRNTLETKQPSNVIKSFQKDEKFLNIEIKVYNLFKGLVILLDDITDIQKREENLERNENLYSSVVDDQSEIICRFNKDLELTFANRAYYQCFGMKNESGLVFSLTEEDSDEMKVHLKSLDEENPVKIFESPMKMPDGDTKWWQWVTKANFDEEGNISEYQSVGRDVTQSHLLIEEFKNNIKKLQVSLKEKDKEIEDLKKSFESKLDEKKVKIDDFEKISNKKYEEYSEELQDLMETIKNQKIELKIFQERENSYKENIKLLKNEINTKNNQLKELRQKIETEINTREQTEKQLQKQTTKLQQQQKETQENQNQINTLKKQISNHKKEAHDLTETIKNQKIELKIFQERENSYKENIKLLKNEINTKNNQLKELRQKIETEINTREQTEKQLQKQKQENQNQINTLKKQISDLRNSELSLRESQERLEKEIENKINELNSAREDLDLEKANRIKAEKNLEDTKNQIRNEIKEKDKEINRIKNDYDARISNLENSERIVRESLEKKENIIKNMRKGVLTNIKMISNLNRFHSDILINDMIKKLEDGRSYLRSLETIPETLYQSNNLEDVNLQEYLDNILSDIPRSPEAENIDLEIEANDLSLDMENSLLTGMIITELVINSFKHTFPNDKGEIRVEVLSEDDNLVIKVSDNSIRLPTQTSLGKKDNGLDLVNTFVEQCEGTLEFIEKDGTTFIVKIPSKHST